MPTVRKKNSILKIHRINLERLALIMQNIEFDKEALNEGDLPSNVSW